MASGEAEEAGSVTPVIMWGSAEVSAWLHAVGFGEYSWCFAKEEIHVCVWLFMDLMVMGSATYQLWKAT